MSFYRKKPVVIEAFEFGGGINKGDDHDWMCDQIKKGTLYFDSESAPEITLKIKTLEGIMTANQGDYIIKGIEGELYPCKPDIFKKTYEKVETQKIIRLDGKSNE